MLALLKLNRGLNNCFKCSVCVQQRFQQTLTQLDIDRHQENVPVFRNATHYADKIALKDTYGNYTYGNLFITANLLSKDISKALEGKHNERILFLCPNDAHYVITQWAIWLSGQIAVPLSSNHPASVIQYYCEDSDAKLLVTTREHADLMTNVANRVNKKLLVLDNKLRQTATRKIPKCMGDLEGGLPNKFYNDTNAMILYTSGTTAKPKGVVLSHRNIQAQVNTLVDAWKWNNTDVILHCLPLNHTHGIINALLCPLTVGAKCIMMKNFDKNIAWGHLLAINTATADRVTVFMGVPTMYSKLIEEYENIFTKNNRVVEYIKSSLKSRIRLMVSGSAPLPSPLFRKWEQISGHRLLERYGMTEIGMCLSNEYNSAREPGYVGIPLPGVRVKLVSTKDDGTTENVLECFNENNKITIMRNPHCKRQDLSGELYVKGESVFNEYFNKKDETKKAFTDDGWFKTGDTASFNINKKVFKLLGRTSVDIIKTGGFKVSALEIETHLLGHPDIDDCAVVGVDDLTWGQRVAALVAVKKGKKMDLEKLRSYSRQKMAEYAVPSIIKTVEHVPKNALSKVNKPELIKRFFSEKHA